MQQVWEMTALEKAIWQGELDSLQGIATWLRQNMSRLELVFRLHHWIEHFQDYPYATSVYFHGLYDIARTQQQYLDVGGTEDELVRKDLSDLQLALNTLSFLDIGLSNKHGW